MGTVTILMYFLGCLNPEDVQAMATSWHLEIRKGEVSCDISPTIMVIYPSVTSTAPPSRCSFCKCSDCLGSSFGFMTCRITWSLALSSQRDFVSTALMLGYVVHCPTGAAWYWHVLTHVPIWISGEWRFHISQGPESLWKFWASRASQVGSRDSKPDTFPGFADESTGIAAWGHWKIQLWPTALYIISKFNPVSYHMHI